MGNPETKATLDYEKSTKTSKWTKNTENWKMSMDTIEKNGINSGAGKTFMICKYQDPYFIPSCNLQSMNMYVQWFALYIFKSG
jgi:hypothetical protein